MEVGGSLTRGSFYYLGLYETPEMADEAARVKRNELYTNNQGSNEIRTFTDDELTRFIAKVREEAKAEIREDFVLTRANIRENQSGSLGRGL